MDVLRNYVSVYVVHCVISTAPAAAAMPITSLGVLNSPPDAYTWIDTQVYDPSVQRSLHTSIDRIHSRPQGAVYTTQPFYIRC